MNFKEILKDNVIIICEDSYKKAILKEMTQNHLLLNMKFYSKKAFLDEYLFKYDENTLAYILKHYHVKVDIAKMYLQNLYYIDSNEDYMEPKLIFLKELKKDLDANHLLRYNPNFLNNISGYQIYVIGEAYLDNHELQIFNLLHAEIMDNNATYSVSNVFSFETMSAEVEFVFKKICELLQKGININHIKLMNVSEDYYNELLRVREFYHLPINIPSNNTLYSNNITKIFLDNLSLGLDEAYHQIEKEDTQIVSQIISICNKYLFIEDKDILKELLISEFKKTKVVNNDYQNYIALINLEDYVSEDDYIFLMNFNAGSIPLSFKDEDYLSDKLKDYLHLKNTITKNKEYKEWTIKKIQSFKNVIITYKLQDNKRVYFPSSLIQTMNLQEINYEDNKLVSYSPMSDKIKYAIALYNYETYGLNNDLDLYMNSLGGINYKTYDNQFKGIEANLLKEYLNHELNLSYSSLSNYNKCAFRYYITNILRLEKYEPNFESFIGSLFHDVLEKCLISGEDIKNEVANYLKKNKPEISPKERFFINKIQDEIILARDTILKQNQNISLKNELHEQEIIIDKSTSDMKINFKGFIDKILYEEDGNNTYIAIIDYKTGPVTTDLKYIPEGLGMQLPIYLYLVCKSPLFTNPHVLGFYLQFVLNKEITHDRQKSYQDLKEDNLKLVGYSIDNIHELVMLDKEYANSHLISGLKVNKDGNFSKNAKILNASMLSELVSIVEAKINENIEGILKADFKINPKIIDYDKLVGCEYCQFKDLCFKKQEDYVSIKKCENIDYLGGIDNAELD